MPRVLGGPLLVQNLHSNRVKLVALDGAGAHLTGIAGSLVVRRSRNGESPSVLITPTITEVDAANMPGVYEIGLSATDLSISGILALRFTGGSIDPTTVLSTVIPRESLVTA